LTEEYLTVSEVKALLKKEQKERGELSQEQSLALQHAETFSRLSVKKARELVKELQEIEHVNEMYAVKITDLLPTEPEDVRAIFARERFTLSKEETERILETVAKYL
jgi:DNA-directed RNA polymerase subunit F